MKKLLYLLILPLLFACHDDEEPDYTIVDIYPIDLAIMIQDDQGVNLLDSTVDGNWYKAQFKAEYEGKIYDADWDVGMRYVEPVQSRMCPYTFYGLYTYPTYMDEKFNRIPAALMFGQFEGDYSYDIEFKLIVPELDKTYDLRFKRTCVTTASGKEFDYESTLNGEPVEGAGIKIILPRRK